MPKRITSLRDEALRLKLARMDWDYEKRQQTRRELATIQAAYESRKAAFMRKIAERNAKRFGPAFDSSVAEGSGDTPSIKPEQDAD